MNVVLIGTYELGRQPFGLASAAAWLRREGATVTMVDLAVERPDEAAFRRARLIAFHVPMHTATRIAAAASERIRAINPDAHLCFFGLYAPMNERFLRRLGADTIIGGEFEEGLAALYRHLASRPADGGSRTGGPQQEPLVSLSRQAFLVPDRQGLPPLDRYARLVLSPDNVRTVGYTEATRGCKHLCRHCPIVPVYGGRFRVVQREVVLEDVRRQVAGGARHITFGDPDFFNGPAHAMAIVERLHAEFPELTYDVTIKIEHLLTHAELFPALKETGCVMVTSAVEAVDDQILTRLDKRHTVADFVHVVSLFRAADLQLNPTFVAFTPWTTRTGYLRLLALIAELDLVDNVSPIQYAIRLLIPHGSKLLELPEIKSLVGPFDESALCYPWAHPDPAVDWLHGQVLEVVRHAAHGLDRRRTFSGVWRRARALLAEGQSGAIEPSEPEAEAPQIVTVPYLTEPWYC
jgi:radical SAM superfamily enzyme YgiQ (UPF0313 family)